MKISTILCVFLFIARPVFPDVAADRDKLPGSWVHADKGATGWIIHAASGRFHITQVEGTATVEDFECEVGGSDCNVKIGGHKATVSLYYNGPALVELETRGSKVIKRRFSILPSGNEMKVEVIPVAGNGPSEELMFERGQMPAGK